MQNTADSMPTPFTHHRNTLAVGKIMNGAANVIQITAGLNSLNADCQRLFSHFEQPLGRRRNLPDRERIASVTAVAIVFQANVHPDNVTFVQNAIIRQAVANFMINRSTNDTGKRRMVAAAALVSFV